MEASEEMSNCNVTVNKKAVITSVQLGGDKNDAPLVSTDDSVLKMANALENNSITSKIPSATMDNNSAGDMSKKEDENCSSILAKPSKHSNENPSHTEPNVTVNNTRNSVHPPENIPLEMACSNIKNLAINDNNMNNERLNLKADIAIANSKRLLGLSALLDYGDTSSDESADNDVEQLILTKLNVNSDNGSTFRINDQNSTSSSSSSSPSNASQFSPNSSSSSSDSEDDVGATGIEDVKSNAGEEQPITAKGELTLDDLPPIQDLNISVAEEECVQMGVVSSIVDRLVMIESLPEQPAYDIDTVLFMDKGNIALGMVHDVFGQVTRPMYVVRFNSREQIAKKNVIPGIPIYAAPKTKHSAYVFIKQLLKMRGSDASWMDGNEPPDGHQDFSDDEQEIQARRRRARHRTEAEQPGKRKMSSKERHESFVKKMNSKNLQESEKYKKAPERYEPEAKRYMPGVHMINSPVRPMRFDLGPQSGPAAGFAHLPPMPVFPPYGYPPPGNMSAFGGGAGAAITFNPAMPPPNPWSLRPPPAAAGFHRLGLPNPPPPGCVPVGPMAHWDPSPYPGPTPHPLLYQGYPGQSQPIPIPIRGQQFRSFNFHTQWGPPAAPTQTNSNNGDSPETRGRSRNRNPMDRHTRIS